MMRLFLMMIQEEVLEDMYFLRQNLISHLSKTQPWVSTSTAESELMEVFRIANEVRHLLGILEGLKRKTNSCTIYTDSRTVIKMLEGENIKPRTRHLGSKIAYLRSLFDNQVMILNWIITEITLLTS